MNRENNDILVYGQWNSAEGGNTSMRCMKDAGRFAGVVSWKRGKWWSTDGRDSLGKDAGQLARGTRRTTSRCAHCSEHVITFGAFLLIPLSPMSGMQVQLSMIRGQCVEGSHDW